MSGAWRTNDITIWKISGWWENDKQCRHCSGLRNNGWSVAGHDDQPNDCSISLVIPTFRLNIARQNDQQGKDLTGQVLILMTGHYFLALNNIYIVYHCLHYLDTVFEMRYRLTCLQSFSKINWNPVFQELFEKEQPKMIKLTLLKSHEFDQKVINMVEIWTIYIFIDIRWIVFAWLGI